MKKTLLGVAPLFLVICVTVPLFAQNKTEAPGIAVISDAPQASPQFVQFFNSFNGKIIQWWLGEGRTATQGKWKISVSEFYNEDMEPRGVTIIVTRFVMPHRIMLSRQLTDGDGGVATDGRVAADIVIEIIKTATKEGQK